MIAPLVYIFLDAPGSSHARREMDLSSARLQLGAGGRAAVPRGPKVRLITGQCVGHTRSRSGCSTLDATGTCARHSCVWRTLHPNGSDAPCGHGLEAHPTALRDYVASHRPRTWSRQRRGLCGRRRRFICADRLDPLPRWTSSSAATPRAPAVADGMRSLRKSSPAVRVPLTRRSRSARRMGLPPRLAPLNLGGAVQLPPRAILNEMPRRSRLLADKSLVLWDLHEPGSRSILTLPERAA